MSLPDYPEGILIHSSIEKLTVPIKSSLFQAMRTMEMANQYGLPAGLSIILDDKKRLAGVITDGDVREALLRGLDSNSPVAEIMTKDPIVVTADVPVENIINEIQRQIQGSGRIRAIKHSILIDSSRHVLGLVDVSRLLMSQPGQTDTIGVIGLGFVGLTLAIALAERGFRVIGFDDNDDVRNALSKGISHIYEPNLEALLKSQLEKKRLTVASSHEELAGCRAFLMCVNTPVINTHPDLSALEGAINALTGLLKPGGLVIVRSTIPVGTSRSMVKNIIESRTNYRAGQDIGLAYAPERTIAGRAMEELHTLPQVIGGINDWSVAAAARIFSRLSPTIIQVDTLEEAEIIKLINNTFRDVSFGFANEVAAICEAYNMDAAKVIRAANTGYPRNPIPLPSPGVGGSCLSKDPYLLLSAKRGSQIPSLGEVSRQINEQIPKNIARRLLDMLRQLEKKPAESVIFVLGFAFKGEPETTDTRNSPTLDLVAELRHKIGTIYGWDAIVLREEIEQTGAKWKDIQEGFTGADAVLFMNNHRDFANIDVYRLVEGMKKPAVLFDGWGMFDAGDIERIQGMNYMGISYSTLGGHLCGGP